MDLGGKGVHTDPFLHFPPSTSTSGSPMEAHSNPFPHEQRLPETHFALGSPWAVQSKGSGLPQLQLWAPKGDSHGFAQTWPLGHSPYMFVLPSVQTKPSPQAQWSP
mmetsp:Transcript_61487/g.73968  ORF Transcript_61487/g.73968 Transcript_61487/m.73968 type:complete len:106 (+) Transcript_61487:444-761(+)